MTNIPLLEKIFDEVYTPNLAVQMTFSNWIHKGKGRKLVEEMAVNCNVELGDYSIKTSKPSTELPEKYIAFNPGSGKGQWEARNYIHWQELVNNLVRELDDVKIVQTGLEGDPLYEGCVDFRGKTNDFKELAYVVENAELVLGIDSVTMHLAAGLGVDHVALFGSSYAGSTGPVQLGKKSKSILLETSNRYSCDKACYKYQCSVDKDHPCINEIDPKFVYAKTLGMLLGSKSADQFIKGLNRYEEYNPKLSGYTHVYNAESGGYPYIESILSMAGFCDEVIVVEGGSTDGTREKLDELAESHSNIQVIENAWDWDEPGMDGQQKAFGRAMCSGDFLWQQDVDEVVHEEDYDKIKKLVKRFPKNVDLVHLPVIELWGDSQTVRTDRHSWKWRLSRNNFRITHGINKHAKVVDEETGKTYAKRGMSDGCEYIDVMTEEMFPHAGFYTQQIENSRVNNPQEYGKIMNQVFQDQPCVFHYSWADIPRKVKNFKQFWDKCWTNLYREQEPEDRFPQVEGPDDKENIQKVATELKERGGEHQKAPTFKLERTNPKLMQEWIEKSQ